MVRLSRGLPAALIEAPGSVDCHLRRRETVDSFISPTPNIRPQINFLYRLVLSRRPVHSYRKWTPARKLEEMTFAELMDELRLHENVHGLKFTVEGPGLRAVEELHRGDELGFDSMCRQIKKLIRGQLTKRPANAPLLFEVDIDPIGGELAGSEDEVRVADFVI